MNLVAIGFLDEFEKDAQLLRRLYTPLIQTPKGMKRLKSLLSPIRGKAAKDITRQRIRESAGISPKGKSRKTSRILRAAGKLPIEVAKTITPLEAPLLGGLELGSAMFTGGAAPVTVPYLAGRSILARMLKK